MSLTVSSYTVSFTQRFISTCSAPNISGTSVRIPVPPIAVSSLQNLPTSGLAVIPESPSDPPHLKPTISLDIGTASLLSPFMVSASSERRRFPSATSSSDSWQTRNFTRLSSTSPRSSLKESIVLFSQPSPITSTPPAFG